MSQRWSTIFCAMGVWGLKLVSKLSSYQKSGFESKWVQLTGYLDDFNSKNLKKAKNHGFMPLIYFNSTHTSDIISLWRFLFNYRKYFWNFSNFIEFLSTSDNLFLILKYILWWLLIEFRISYSLSPVLIKMDQ